MSESPVTLPKSFQGGSAGGCAIFGSVLFLGPFAAGLFAWLSKDLGVDEFTSAGVAGGAFLVVSTALYVFFNSLTTITVDRHGLSVSHQSGLGPIRGRVIKDYDVSWASLDRVYDVEKRRMTKHGNVNASYEFRAGDHTIHSAILGTMARDGQYLAFLTAVRAAVGDKLVQKDDLGELEAPLQRMIDKRIAESDASDEPPAPRPPRAG